MSDKDRPEPLASDSDRDASVLALRDATVEGRLTLGEFSERVEQAHAARTQAQLATLTRDLPAPAEPVAEASHRAFCSMFVRPGVWTVTVIVPPSVAVEVDGGGHFASRVIDPPTVPPIAGAPVQRIRAPGGTLYVRQSDEPGTLARLLTAG